MTYFEVYSRRRKRMDFAMTWVSKIIDLCQFCCQYIVLNYFDLAELWFFLILGCVQ